MPVHYELTEPGIVTLTLDDQAARNALTDKEMLEGFIAALERAERDDEVRVIILTGAGPSFSSGGNVKAMGRYYGVNDPSHARTRQNYRRGIQRIPLLMESMETPIVAAVNGHAIGAGLDLALLCDIRIAADSAQFAESFVRMGIIPGDGGAWLLPRVVGFARASELALTGDMIDAAEGLRIGLVSRVVPRAELAEAALIVARKMAVHSPHALRMTRRLLREAWRLSLPQTLELSAAYQALAHSTDDHAEAVDAFLEKRPPVYRGS